jgi:malate synthase
VWQWIHNPNAKLDDGRPITPAMFHAVTQDVLAELREQVGEAYFAANHYEQAAELFEEISLADTFPDFLTLKAYDYLD